MCEIKNLARLFNNLTDVRWIIFNKGWCVYTLFRDGIWGCQYFILINLSQPKEENSDNNLQ